MYSGIITAVILVSTKLLLGLIGRLDVLIAKWPEFVVIEAVNVKREGLILKIENYELSQSEHWNRAHNKLVVSSSVRVA